MMPHTQLTLHDRITLARLLQAKVKQKDIAKIPSRSPSAVSRELKRNRDKNGQYRARTASKKLGKRRTRANQKFRKTSSKLPLRQFVVRKLKKYWSPEQIAGYLARKHGEKLICHETVYRFVYNERPGLKKYLRCKKRKYRRRHGTVAREEARREASKRRIDTRPPAVEGRERIGDWEGDTIVGGDRKSAVLTHVERKSGYLLADRLERALAERVRHVTVRGFARLPRKKRRTVTYDNGSEFEDHQTTEARLQLTVYFAYPYHAWERGTNENTNGLLRQFFPKGTDFTKITDFDLQRAVKLINTRPRKRLGYHTPNEVFSGKVAIRTGI